MKKALSLAILECISFFVICVSFIALADRNMLATAVSDGLVLIIGFSIFKKMQTAETLLDRTFYIIGGVAGSQLAILFADKVYPH